MTRPPGSLRWVLAERGPGLLVPGSDTPYRPGDKVRNHGGARRSKDSDRTAFENALGYTKTKSLPERMFLLLVLVTLARCSPTRVRELGITVQDGGAISLTELQKLRAFCGSTAVHRDVLNHFPKSLKPVIQCESCSGEWILRLREELKASLEAGVEDPVCSFEAGVVDSMVGVLRAERTPEAKPSAVTPPSRSSSPLPDHPAPPVHRVSDALQKVRYLSETAATAAGTVLSEMEGGPAVGAVSLSDVYVERTLEKQLLADIEHSPPGSVFTVFGEAGAGKTSLLWHLHKELSGRGLFDAWLLRARMTKEIASEALVQCIHEAQRAGRTPVLFLDTVDLLLHSEQDSDRLSVLVLSAQDAGCSVVMTCRPGEETLLPKNIIHKSHPKLEDFDPDELARAKESYIRRFYSRLDPKEMQKHADELDHLMAGRHTLVELMRHPLTLRMLFHLYAPHDIPPEVDVVSLYVDYWRRRVTTDTRPGSQHPTDSTDLGPAVSLLALAMLQEGGPSLEERAADALLRRSKLPDQHLTKLIDRGVLRRVGGTEAVVELFHQTFFEHAAARGLLTFGQENGIEMALDRMMRHPEDLLVGAVLEQTLVIAPTEIYPFRPPVEKALGSLLDSSHVALQSVAVGAVARLPPLSAELQTHLEHKLSEPDLAKRWIDLSPSLPSARMDEVFHRFSSIWRSSVNRKSAWRSCQHVLDALSRLAMRGGAFASQGLLFLQEHGVGPIALERHGRQDAMTAYLKVLRAIAPHDSAVWREYVVLAQGARKDLIAIVLLEIARAAPALGRKTAASDLQAALANVEGGETASTDPNQGADNAKTDTNRAWGELWSAEWRLRSMGIAAILGLVSAERSRIHHVRLLNGVAVVLKRGAPSDVSVAFAEYLAESDTQRRSDWNSVVWAPVLSDSETPVEVASAVAERVGEHFSRSEDLPRVRALASQIAHNGGPSSVLAQIWTTPAFDDPGRWLSEDDLGPLISFACASGQSAATRAIEQLIAAPKTHWRTATGAVGAMRRHRSARALDVFFSLAAAVGNLEAISGVLAEIPQSEQASLKEHEAFLNGLVRRGWTSHRATDRSGSVRIWLELLRLSSSDPTLPKELHVLERLQKEGDPPVRAWLASLLGEVSALSSEAEEALRSAAIKGDESLRNKALSGWIRYVRRLGLTPVRAIEVMTAAASPPVDAGRLKEMGWLIDDLVPQNMELARRVIEALFLSATHELKDRQGFRDLRANLRTPIRKWMAAAPPGLARSLLALIPRIHPELGCNLVEAAAKEAFRALQADLRQVMNNPQVPRDVSNYVEVHLRLRKTSLPSPAPWLELAKLTAGYPTR